MLLTLLNFIIIMTMMDGVEITRTSGPLAPRSRNSVSRTRWLMEGVFSGGDHSQRSRRVADEDEEALIWAAIEKLPTYDRLRKSIIQSLIESDLLGNQIVSTEVDVKKLDMNDKQKFINRVFTVAEEDNEKYLKKFRERIYKVGLKLPTIEVRFENLTVEGNCYIGKRALPSLPNVARNIAESSLSMLGINLANTTKVKILKNISGVLKPSRLTLLLGPPSSGKSTLLLALAGLLDPKLKVEGEITYNGYKLNEFVVRKTCAYISQNDLHIGNMTVRETLDFSARCQGVGTRYDLVSELVRREKDAGIYPEADLDLFMKATAVEGAKNSLVTDYTLKILGLDICKDSIIGDAMRRGISGGQKKRVTTGEMIVGPTKALFMDEISTGLDSSTTYQIVKCMQQIVHLTEATILMSLLQPTPETFDLFDDIIFLSEGVIVYQGPREHILDFFESCGFRCPERKSVADFLQEVTSRKDQELYWSDRNKPYHYVSVLEFAEMFKRFHVGMHLHHELSVPFDKSQCHKAALALTKYSLTKVEMLKACWDREWILVKRNPVYVSMLVQIIVLATITSTVFLRVHMHTKNEEDGALYVHVVMFCLMNSMFNGFPELPLTIRRLPVFYKQRELLFHPAWAFTLSSFLLQLPVTAVKSIVWVGVTYYTTGLAPEPSRFFKHLLLTFLIQQMACGLFRLIAGVCRTIVVSSTGGSLMLILLLILGGFIVQKDSLPNWIEWGYWVSPLPYAYNAFAVNEMFSPRWMNKLASDNITKLGVAVLKNVGCFPSEKWYWIGVVAMAGYIILFNVIFTIALAYLSDPGKPQAIIAEEAANEMESEPRVNRNVHKKDPFSLSSSSESNSTRETEIQRRSNSNRGGPSREADSSSPKMGMALHFTPLAMSFNCVNYFVDMPPEIREQGVGNDRLQLLKEVTGAFRPGVLTALMGVSGAGKTTLMDVLAGRKTTGFIEGDISISGFPKQQETFARICGYCEQNDIHSPQVTVRESLIFSAFLRLPKEISKQEKITFVDEVMELVELSSLKNVIVGIPGTTGLSTEQRKRLTIAVELVANPSIIFMDEPTSGLDARAAAIVMRAVRNTVDTGRTVVCTIHQPNIDIFEAFDELLLMKRGGEVIYSGPLGRNSHKMIEYFEAIPGVPKIKEKYNPSTWMLEVSSVAAENRLGIDFAEHYRSSSKYQRYKDLVKELSTPPPGARDLYFATQYSESAWGQLKLCLWKQQLTYWRSPDYNLVRFGFTFLVTLILGVLLWRIGAKRESTNDLITILGAMQCAVLAVGSNSCGCVQPMVAVERGVFYRERAAGMYSALPYGFAMVISEIPYVLAQAAIFSIIVFSMMGFEWAVAKFFWFFFVMFFTLLFWVYYGMVTVSITPNLQTATIVSSSFAGIFSLFSGFIIPRSRIPKWWIWVPWICPPSWTIYGVIVSQFGDVEDRVKSPGIFPDPTIKWYIENKLGYDPSFMGQVAALLVSFPIVCALLLAFALRI